MDLSVIEQFDESIYLPNIVFFKMSSDSSPCPSDSTSSPSGNDSQRYSSDDEEIEVGEVSSDESFEEISMDREEDHFDEISAAFQGMKLIVTNRLKDAENHFQSFRMYSAPMANGYCFVQLIRAILSLETADVEHAKATIKSSEKLYKQIKTAKHANDFAKLYASICQADAYLYKAALLLIKFDLSLAIHVGWYVRKATKQFVSNMSAIEKSKSQLSSEEYTVLQTASSFGVGLSNWGLSILPPSYASLLNIMGYSCDRIKGLKRLDQCRRGSDFRSPLASVVMLWYYLIAKPLMGAQAEDLLLGIAVATEMMGEAEKNLTKNSWFYHFFGARLKLVTNQVDDGLKSLIEARDACDNGDSGKIRIFLVYEIGWCYIIKCQYDEALKQFFEIKDLSHWSEGLYPYVTGLCLCMCGEIQEGINLFERNAAVKKKSPNNTEYYVLTRSKLAATLEIMKSNPSANFQLLIYEMLYLWNHLSLVSPENRKDVFACVNKMEHFDLKLRPCAYLLRGALQNISEQYSDAVDTLENLKTYLSTQKNCYSLERSYGLYELALAKYKLLNGIGDVEQIHEILEKSVTATGYQFENRLKLKVDNLRSDLSGAETSSSSSQNTVTGKDFHERGDC